MTAPVKKEKAEPAHYIGHRARLRERFLNNGADALADYEVLELLLGLSIRQGDMKPLAKQLLKEFGSFTGILSASAEDLQRIKGVGALTAETIKIIHTAALRTAQNDISNQPILSSWEKVLDYCQTSIGYLKIEQFSLLFLDKKNRLILDEVQQQGTIDHTPAYPREIVKRALNLGASALILLHNHPSGDPKPSQADIELTRVIIDAAKAVGITVHDHLIIAKGKHFSFRASGLISN